MMINETKMIANVLETRGTSVNVVIVQVQEAYMDIL